MRGIGSSDGGQFAVGGGVALVGLRELSRAQPKTAAIPVVPRRRELSQRAAGRPGCHSCGTDPQTDVVPRALSR